MWKSDDAMWISHLTIQQNQLAAEHCRMEIEKSGNTENYICRNKFFEHQINGDIFPLIYKLK